MDLKGLQYVVAVADAGSFTDAASALFVAQPALSRKVAQIEREFGAEFFVRSGRRIGLTEAGKVFCRDARRILSGCQRLEQDMDQLLRQAESLRLLCTTNGAVSYAARLVNALREKYPALETAVQTLASFPETDNNFTRALELLRQGQSDVLLAFLPEIRGEGLDWLDHRRVEPGGLCAFVTRGHPLFEKDSVRAAELQKYTLILPSDTAAPALSRGVSRALGDPPHVICSPSFTDFRVRVVTENHVGVMPASSRTIADPFLHCLDIEDVSGGFDLEAVWVKGRETAAIKKLLTVLSPD